MKIILLILLTIPLIIVAFILAAFFMSLILRLKRPIRKLYDKRIAEGDFCKYSALPHKTIDCILAMEDINFFEHKGYDPKAIQRAFQKNLKQKKIVMGGSTITQQLAKNLYYKFDRHFFRKFSEFFTALYIERNLSKTEILELYLNVIYYGNGIYGLNNAARFYFDKDCPELDVTQLFCILALLSSPTEANPLSNQEAFYKLRNKKVSQLIWLGKEKEYVQLITDNSDGIFDYAIKKHGIQTMGKPIMINEKYYRNKFY